MQNIWETWLENSVSWFTYLWETLLLSPLLVGSINHILQRKHIKYSMKLIIDIDPKWAIRYKRDSKNHARYIPKHY
jgi:hypothetical protein